MTPTLTDLLNFRTFSSVWYWITLALVWTSASHRPLGVPYDMVRRARRGRDGAGADLHLVALTFARRLTAGVAAAAGAIVATGSALVTALVMLATLYGSELAQGVALIVLPMGLVGWMNLRTARTIVAGGDPQRHLGRLRAATNAIALVTLFLAAFWGTYVNFAASVL
jgi:hypothetical protein